MERGRLDAAERFGVRLCGMRPTRSRRRFLFDAGAGLVSVALPWLMAAGPGRRAEGDRDDRPPHHPPRVKRVVQIFACGGVSHVDTFDHKPELARLDGREMSGVGDDREAVLRPDRAA